MLMKEREDEKFGTGRGAASSVDVFSIASIAPKYTLESNSCLMLDSIFNTTCYPLSLQTYSRTSWDSIRKVNFYQHNDTGSVQPNTPNFTE
eukprot:scaffold3240_cov197-Alexandrium_tamarense.AAC.30